MTEAVDLTITTIGFPLIAARRYDSTRAIDGPMGFGWTSSVAPRLYYATYLFAAPSTYQKEADITMPDGWSLRYVDPGTGPFTPPSGRKDVLVHNADGSFDLTLQRSRSVYRFTATGQLASTTDDFGNALTYTYDASSRLQQIADAAGSGRYLNVYWGANGRISSVQDNTGRQVQYAYSAQGTLTTMTDPAGRVTTYAYNTGRFAPVLARITDNWARILTDVAYDNADRVISYTQAGETYTYTYAYGGSAAVTAKTDSQRNRFLYPFGPGGLVTDTTPPAGGPGPTHTTFYPDGSLMTFTDATSVTTTYTYNSNGTPSQVIQDATGSNPVRYDYTYDPAFPDRPTVITPKLLNGSPAPDWQGWQYDYWQTGDPAPGALRHVYRVRSDGTTLDTITTYAYNTHGQLTQETKATGATIDYAYDPQGNLLSITAPTNNNAGTRPVTTYAYDAVGRVTGITDPLGHQTLYTYDALNRITTLTLPKPTIGSSLNFLTTYAYDSFDAATGLVFASITDANGIMSRHGYDQFGQHIKAIDGMNNTTTHTFTRGLLTGVTDANNNTTTYTYDAGRRLARKTYPDGAYESYSYTPDSLLASKTDRKAEQTAYAYDAFKRLTTTTYAAGSVSNTFVGQKLTQIVDTTQTPTETHTFAYDPSFRLTQNVQWNRGTLSYTYNIDDTVATRAVNGGASTTYSYYPDSSLSSLDWSPVAGQFQYAYTLTGRYASITFPNGQSRNYTYDDQGRMLQVANLLAGGGTIATYAYGYDLNYTTGAYTRLGQRVALTATVPSQALAGHLTTYEYDALYQLTKTTYPNVAPLNGEVDAWTYDRIGNRLTSTVNGTPQTYTYQKIGTNPDNWQRVLNDGTAPYTYDANGNTTIKGSNTYTWDRDNRLTGITGTTTAAYSYDYQGRRWGKTTTDNITYTYDGLNAIAELGTSPAAYLFGPAVDEPLAMSRGGQTYYYSVDGIGTAVALTDATGTVRNTSLHDAWGQTRSVAEQVTSPFTFTGREKAEAAGLYYRARTYLPAIGRFLSEDPRPGTAAFVYALNRPVSLVDPSGEYTACPGGCNCGLWSTVRMTTIDLGAYSNWILVSETPFETAPLARKIPQATLMGPTCTCVYRWAGDAHDWQSYTYKERSVDCPQCVSYMQYEGFYGDPYTTEQPGLHVPGHEEYTFLIVPHTGGGGCLCPGRLPRYAGGR
ncbi:MAG: hypothetical protein M3167_00345 [Acidobacteriota bacterium]|nr:hypothetical protein [Acidobacteriota bacterium]